MQTQNWQLPCGCARFTGTAGERPSVEHGFYSGWKRRWVQSAKRYAFDAMELAWIGALFPNRYAWHPLHHPLRCTTMAKTTQIRVAKKRIRKDGHKKSVNGLKMFITALQDINALPNVHIRDLYRPAVNKVPTDLRRTKAEQIQRRIHLIKMGLV